MTNKKQNERSFRLPRPIIAFSSGGTSLSELVRGNGYDESAYPWAARMLGRFPLPSWQRGLVWTEEQNQNFIESVFQGYDLGSIMVNSWQEGDNGVMIPMSDILLDGQQRTNAVIQFTRNAFPYEGYYWNDLNRREQRVFLETQIGIKKTRCFDEEILKKVYNHLNFSGVRHELSQMA
ncbi:DUF262 domain-containing protein (plasmid) [Photobacterium leiognathi subsp. mandapamensis]